MTTVLVVDDSPVDRRLLGELLGGRSDWTIQYAADGVEALSRVKEASPDLIVTDLRMPKMDGLDLVKAVRTDYPSVPVVLITAFGSEMLAVEALKLGAAGYVPKSQLAEKLLDTAEEVLTLSQADRNYERMIRRLSRSELSFFLELENDGALIDPLIELVKQSVASLRLCDATGQVRIGVALKEALLNAMYHGNLEADFDERQTAQDAAVALVQERRSQPPYRDRRVFVDVTVSRDEARFVIQDEGPGFDVSAIPDPKDSTTGQGSGRGLSLMRMFMDEVVFNSVGNKVAMLKRREDDT
ncbi:MAG: ATP-binding protein [Planctomycetota bacterium]